jgi:hypothetical protein
MRSLGLLIPDLLPVTPDLEKDAFPVPATPCLARMLARGSVSVDPLVSNRERQLLQLFGVEPAISESLPLAAVMRIAEGRAPDANWWLRLDAVNLQADVDKLVLQPPGALPLDAEANRAFGAVLGQVLACGDGDLEPAATGGWYLRLVDDPEMTTLPPVAGRAVAPLDVLPAGKGAPRWHKAITEVQMLLHQFEETSNSESYALRGVNSVWVWGAGRCPDQVRAPAQGLFGDGELLHGLGRLAGVEVTGVPEDFDALQHGGSAVESGLVAIEAPAGATAATDPWTWRLWLQQLEAAWFEPLWRSLGRGQIRELSVWPGMGAEFRVTRQALVKFWPRSRPVTHWGRRLAACN